MPKFTQEELEEIRRNTEEVEQARKGKKSSTDEPAKKPRKPRKSSKKEEYSVKDRLVALGLLIATVLVSILVWKVYGPQ
jgi:hypothetical protein